RQVVIDTLGKYDPLIRDALLTVVKREDFIQPIPAEEPNAGQTNKPPSIFGPQIPIENDPQIPTDLIKRSQRSLAELKQNIQSKSGPKLFDFILEDLQEAKKLLFDPQNLAVIMAAMNASLWINEKMEEWLGEINAADTLSQSVPNNITSEMGLALLDVADVIRGFPEVVGYLQHVKDDDFLDHLAEFKGGQEVRDSIDAYLDK